MKFKHYFWDYDGTLFNTYPSVTKGFLLALKEFGKDIDYGDTFELTKQSLGFAAKTLAERYHLDKDDILARYYEHAKVEETFETMRPFTGARETLEEIVRQGGVNYLYTHRGKGGAETVSHYGMGDLFADSITKDDGFPRKPAPDALNYLVNKHRLDPKECVMVGDRALDVEAGLNAKMSGVLLDPDGLCREAPTPYKYTTFAEFKKALVDVD